MRLNIGQWRCVRIYATYAFHAKGMHILDVAWQEAALRIDLSFNRLLRPTKSTRPASKSKRKQLQVTVAAAVDVATRPEETAFVDDSLVLGPSSLTRASPETVIEQEHGARGSFNWQKNWYPVQLVENLDAKVPYAFDLLGKRLVLWRDAEEQWRCFEDKCPHRLAPMSEGRIHRDGTLMCSYHGWRFQGDGACVDIPQSLDAKANATARASPRSCIKAHPVKVSQDKVWVWGDCSPSAIIDCQMVQPVLNPFLADVPGIQGIDGSEMLEVDRAMMRDLPYSWDCLVENVIDPSHVNWSHHNHIGERGHEMSGHMLMIPGVQPSNIPWPEHSFSVAVESFVKGAKGMEKWEVHFFAPGLAVWTLPMPWGTGILTLHCVPTLPGKSRVFASLYTAANTVPLPLRIMFRHFVCGWWEHIHGGLTILDGDAQLILGQSYANMEEESPKAAYYMPAQADRLVSKFRRWLEGEGGGGPMARAPLPPMEKRKDVLLERWHSHTAQCKTCQKGFKIVRAAQLAAIALAAVLAFGLAAALGQGTAPVSRASACLVAGMTACGAAWLALQRLAQSFIYVEWNHALNE
ncbi:g7712 [Coccomyxa viridis]|uniref:G7712 protein n=1 Tax=Coccomyxa viridis TaxID=1274662 RepID=A0ABP1FYN1_9CHLO